jgi:hypothetical protein
MGATTIEEYRKYIEKDTALARRFQVGSGFLFPFFAGASDLSYAFVIYEKIAILTCWHYSRLLICFWRDVIWGGVMWCASFLVREFD